MARHGENIRKRKDGRWEGRYLVYCTQKAKKMYVSVYGKSYDDVKKKLTLKRNSMISPQNTVIHTGTDLLFTDVTEEWLDRVKTTRKRSTYVKYQSICKIYLKELFCHRKLTEITDCIVHESIPFQLSKSMQNSIFCVVNQILGFAEKKYSIEIVKIKRQSSDSLKNSYDTLTMKEQERLLTSLFHEKNIYKTAVLLCMHSGLRLGELCALKWSDIDLKNKILTVNQTVQRLRMDNYPAKTMLLETAPKSIHSHREIPLSDMTLRILLSLHTDVDYVFGGAKPLEPRTMQYQFKKILREAGLPPKNFHVLRHTFATNCVEGGIDVKSLSEILGHSNVQITLNRYVHPSMETKRKYLTELSKFYGQIRGQHNLTGH